LIGIVVYDLGYMSDPDYKSPVDFLNNSLWSKVWFKCVINFTTSLIFLFPLSLIKNYGKFGMLSLLSIVSLMYITLVLIIETFWYVSHNNNLPNPPKIHWADMSEGFGEGLLFFPAMAASFFANGNAISVLPVLREIKDPTDERIKKVVRRSELLILVFYLLVGITGYISFPGNTPSLIILRQSIFTSDIFMTIGKIMLYLSLLISFSTNFNVIRISGARIIRLFFKKKKEDLQADLIAENKESENNYFNEEPLENNKKQPSICCCFYNYKTLDLLFTFVSVMLIALISTFYDGIISLLTIIGGFFVVIIHYFVIGILIVKSSEFKWHDCENLCMIVTVTLLLILGWTGGIISIYNSASGIDMAPQC
jgi:amino acid permease